MQWSELPWKPTNRTLRQFAGLWILVFGALAVWQAWVEGQLGVSLILAAAAVLVGGLGLIRPQAIRWLFVTWTVLGFPIGWLILNACLALIFFGLLTPLGVCFRLLGRDALDLHAAKERATNWQPKPVAPLPNYYRTF